ncbi:hypothetical protein FHX10_006969 [Rhizobium sp. BK591]|nr:hypothetical protein [Rhizobium sp. BK591]
MRVSRLLAILEQTSPEKLREILEEIKAMNAAK